MDLFKLQEASSEKAITISGRKRDIKAIRKKKQAKNAQEMSMEGQVHLVEQPLAAAAGGRPAEPGIDIRGDQMQLTRATRPDAKAIVSGRPAIVKGRGLDLQGPMVEFDRGQNRLTVDGAGKLSLPMAGGAGALESLAFTGNAPPPPAAATTPSRAMKPWLLVAGLESA
jgi:hypothetical protein